MKKIILLFMLPLFAFSIISCDDEEEVLNTKLIKGEWQLVSQDSPERDYIFSFTTPNESTWSWGTLTTYYLTDPGHAVHDKVYKWHVDDPNNNEIVYLDITFQGDIDGEDEWDNTDRYIVEKLTSTEMLLKEVKVGNDETILRFIRRNDLQLP